MSRASRRTRRASTASRGDRAYPEGPRSWRRGRVRTRAKRVICGGVVGTVIAGSVEFNTLQRLGFLPTLGIGLIEEASKLIVPIGLLLLGTRVAGRANGLIVGVTVGMAFAALETMGYAFVALL